jgi:7-keto-8-aminopelargonate synthetase-like enzyme
MLRTDTSRSAGLDKPQPTGETRRCINLGSYNYLGFAASDEYCTPRVLATLHKAGVSACSARLGAGTTPVHQGERVGG